MTDEDDQNAAASAPESPATTATPGAATRLPVLHSSGELPPIPGAPGAPGAAQFVPTSHNRKLAPVERIPTGSRPRPRARRPFVSATDVSIAATCSAACPFKGRGCFADAGFTRFKARELDAAAHGLTADQVIAEEARLIDGAFNSGRVPQDGARGGRDIRLHVGDDVSSTLGAQLLADAAGRWRNRGGAAVWSFTHTWREVSREAWGSISMLASIEQPEDIQAARAAGYVAAIVVDKSPPTRRSPCRGRPRRSSRAPPRRGTRRVWSAGCASAPTSWPGGTSPSRSEAHGPTARRVREALVQQRVLVVEKSGADRSRGRRAR